jgi:hypothetical protein
MSEVKENRVRNLWFLIVFPVLSSRLQDQPGLKSTQTIESKVRTERYGDCSIDSASDDEGCWGSSGQPREQQALFEQPPKSGPEKGNQQ